MKRLAFLLLLLASAVFAQTYVRPSKGTPIPAFAAYADAGVVIAASGSPLPTSLTGTQYEWSAFETVRVRVTARSGTNYWGVSCTGTTQVLQYDLQGVATVFRMNLQRSGLASATRWTLNAFTAAQPVGNTLGGWGIGTGFTAMTSPNSTMNLSPKFLGCTIDVSLVPVPFASPVEMVDADGGVVQRQVGAPYQCRATYQSTYLMDGGAIAMGVAPSRVYSVVCNSRDNSTGVVRCRADGADAGVLSTTAGSIGDVLSVGDCISYSNGTDVPFYCIGSGNWTTVFECTP